MRAARVEDGEGIARVIVSAWRDTYHGPMPNELLDNLSVEERAARWKIRLGNKNDPYNRAFVAESNKMVVGFAGYGRNLEEDPLYTGEHHALYILNEFRGQGLGRRVVSQAASVLIELNMTSLVIRVFSKNP